MTLTQRAPRPKLASTFGWGRARARVGEALCSSSLLCLECKGRGGGAGRALRPRPPSLPRGQSGARRCPGAGGPAFSLPRPRPGAALGWESRVQKRREAGSSLHWCAAKPGRQSRRRRSRGSPWPLAGLEAPAPRARSCSAASPLRALGGRRQDAGGRLHAAEGRRAGEAQRRVAAAVEEEALHPHRGRAAARPAQAAPAGAAGGAGGGGGGGSPRRGGGGGQDQGAALLHHEDGGLRGAEGQVRVLHGGDGRGQRDRLSVPAGAGLERRDHAAAGAVQEPPGHPGRQVHPAEAAAPRPAARPRAPAPERLQLRLAGPRPAARPRLRVELKRHLQARWILYLLITDLTNKRNTVT